MCWISENLSVFLKFKSFSIAADLVRLVTLEKVVYMHQTHVLWWKLVETLSEAALVEDFLQLSHWEDALVFH